MIETPRHPGLGRTTRHTASRHLGFFAGVLVLLAMLSVTGAGAGPPRIIVEPPRPPDVIKDVLSRGAHAGDCDQCHSMHGENQPTVYPNALVGPDDNTLCEHCHSTPWSGGSFANDYLYRGTGHGSSTSMVWPGPVPSLRIEVDAATKCVNCHDPHGWTDRIGLIPALALQREEKLCLTCHDGSPAATNIAAELVKPYRHPTTDFADRHTGPGESEPSDFGVMPVNRRHAECPDCHNPHVSRHDGGLRGDPDEASLFTRGVSRVAVVNGAANTRPLYTFIPASDTLTTPDTEYQLCFKCHSSWTTQPSGQTDLARALNPANPSQHPVEDVGRNTGISSQAFAAGWSATSRTRCGDCHGSDFGSTAGPHGSSYAGLLRQPYTASPLPRTSSSDELCFQCHSYDVYANRNAPASVRAASRFNGPGATQGHAEHVDGGNVPCFACHVTHGSSTLPFLLVVGRSPGIITYTRTATGGTCSPTCHDMQSYQVNYAR